LLDAKGEPHLTDFGLAKRIDGDGELTRTGAVLGTPAYMAPEQATGRRGEVTVATDVYGLGALLYALLTGHTPFRGEGLADTLVQVREGSPEPIRRANARVPRDLETIGMRCLEREPRRRYASAEAVAEELGRWLRGEPIVARPAGKLERGWMWCRRNPVVAGLIAAVAAVLILSTAVSTAFAVRESDRARAAGQERRRAESAEADARKARDAIEGTFARSLIEPLDAGGDAGETLGAFEVEALWELAGDGPGSLGLRFLDEAARVQETARQLCARAEPALIAAVGLDPKKRERAIGLMMRRLGETGLPPAQKADIALTILGLTDRPGPEARACEEALAVAIEADPPADRLAAWKAHLIREVELLEPETAARLLLLVLHRETDAARFGSLAVALAKAASRLETPIAAGVCGEALGLLTDVPAKDTNSRIHQELSGGIAALATGMPRGEAVRPLADALGRVTKEEARQRLVEGLETVIRAMSPDDRREAIRSLADTLGRLSDPGARRRLATGLAAVITSLPPDDTADLTAVVARTLAEAFGHEGDAGARDDLASDLARLAKSGRKLEVSELRPVVQSLAASLKGEKDPTRRGRLACALAPLAERLGPEESTRIRLATAEDLSSDWTETNKFDPDQEWIRGLGELMIRSPMDRAVRNARLLARVADSLHRRDPQNFRVTEKFHDVVGSLNAADAARTAPVLVAALGQESDPSIRWWLAASLCMMAEKMDPEEAARVCGPVVGDMGEAIAPAGWTRGNVINGFVIAASRQVPAVASRSARVLADVGKSERTAGGEHLARSLTTLTSRMEPVEAALVCGEVARALAEVLKKNPSDVDAAKGLEILASRMKPIEAERLRGEVARILADALSRYGTDDQKGRLEKGLATVAQGSNPADAARLLTDALSREMEAHARQSLAEGLAAAVGRMEPAAAARVCDRTIRTLLRARSARPREVEHRRGFDSAVAALLPGLPAQEARTRAASLAAVMCSEGDLCRDLQDPQVVAGVMTPENERMRATLSRVLTDTRQAPGDLRPDPSPCRLTTQELADLLKMPTCFGRARGVVLDQLGILHGRRFANHWEFVGFARENRLAIDLTTPPRRPDEAALASEEAPPR
jgi:hypothetical protein